MPEYRRQRQPGGCYFFTVTLNFRHNNDLLIRHIAELRTTVAQVRHKHPFRIHGWVVLPDHLHCLIELPPDDHDYSIRWNLIKGNFSRRIPCHLTTSRSMQKRGERGIWQRRFWEHLIRDERDYRAHMDYIHINPLKHGLVERVVDWPYSTFHRLVEHGVYTADWANGGYAETLGYND